MYKIFCVLKNSSFKHFILIMYTRHTLSVCRAVSKQLTTSLYHIENLSVTKWKVLSTQTTWKTKILKKIICFSVCRLIVWQWTVTERQSFAIKDLFVYFGSMLTLFVGISFVGAAYVGHFTAHTCASLWNFVWNGVKKRTTKTRVVQWRKFHHKTQLGYRNNNKNGNTKVLPIVAQKSFNWKVRVESNRKWKVTKVNVLKKNHLLYHFIFFLLLLMSDDKTLFIFTVFIFTYLLMIHNQYFL